MEAKEDIRSRLNIEDVVGEYIQLRRAGRNFKGLSPFSNEKTPSFMVSPEKHIWHDFSSNKGGDVFSFVMEMEGVDFRGALEILARKAGVDLSQYEQKSDKGLSQKKERLFKLLELSARFYQQSLVNNQKALEYVFKKRKLTKTVVGQFMIGYAPHADDALLNFLQKRGYKQNDIRDAGLLAMRRGKPSDMFRGRMMVPLCDGQGRVVGFTARLIDNVPHAPKYINTPQTLLYDKGRQVFGLHLAKEAIRTYNYAVIVEGNLDVVASHQAGVAQVVATAGTAMTESHLRALSRLTGTIRLAFDRDQAGITATERAIAIASGLGLQLGIVSVPEGFKDPDELIQTEPKKWQTVVESPQDALEWLLDEYARKFDLRTAEGKRRTTTKALEVIRQLTDPVEQEHYLNLLATRTGTTLGAIAAKLNTLADPAPKVLKTPKVQLTAPDANAYQDRLLALTLTYPPLRDLLHHLDADSFAGRLRKAIFEIIVRLENRPLTDELLEKLQPDELCVKIQELSLIIESEEKYTTLSDALYAEIRTYKNKMLQTKKRHEKNDLFEQLQHTTDQIQRKNLNNRIKQLSKEIEALKR